MAADSSSGEVSLHVLTWNVAGNIPALHDIESLFLPQKSLGMRDIPSSADILVIGLQEAYPNVQEVVTAAIPLIGRDPLVDNFSLVLSTSGFTRLTYFRILGIVIMVFVKRPLLCYIHQVESTSYRTGVGGVWANKGATSVRFTIGDTCISFTNCHLVPHLENNPRRVVELHDILLYSVYPNSNSTPFEHDIVVLFGDLNFRIEGQEFDDVVQLVANGGHQSLCKLDQLLLEQVKGSRSPSHLHRFMEMQIDFVPSYKYEPGTDRYHDGGKGRAPAWTDRVLWHINARKLPQVTDVIPKLIVQPQYYGLHPQPRTSDHKAVSASLKLLTDLSQSPPVMFRLSEWICSTSGRIEIDIAPGTVISTWDWIGLYSEDFISVERDVVYWIYTPAVRGSATSMTYYSKPLNSDQVPAEPGRYRLLYKSNHYKRVLGMSPLFRITSAQV